jgi:hypothetical protein
VSCRTWWVQFLLADLFFDFVYHHINHQCCCPAPPAPQGQLFAASHATR